MKSRLNTKIVFINTLISHLNADNFTSNADNFTSKRHTNHESSGCTEVVQAEPLP